MYRYQDEDYFRVTAVVSSKECEAVGYNVKQGTSKDLVVNAVTLPGSLMHWKIEKFLMEVKGRGPSEPIHWSTGALQILEEWEQNGELQERLIMPADEGFQGFLQFYRDPKYSYINESGERVPGIDPILIEHNMFVQNFASTGFRVAGTTDLIARVWLKGRVEPDGYFHVCKHYRGDDPLCTCTHQWVVTVMDWKYSIMKQASHPEQLSAYHYMATVTGAFQIASENGNFPINYENWSGLFKKPNHAIGYDLWTYPQDLSGFLSALEIMRDPKPRTLNHRNFTYGLKGRCMFCAYQNNCPDRRMITEKQTVFVEGDLSEGRYAVEE
jgi:hypothetical protein